MLLALKMLFFLTVFCYAVAAYIASPPTGGPHSYHPLNRGGLATSSQDAGLGRCQAPASGTGYGASLQAPRKEQRSRDGAVGYAGAVTSVGAAVLMDNLPLTSVDNLRRVYGQRRHWWGDLTAHETRRFYHELLPVSLGFEMDASLTLEERARLASMARHAARLYARERCALPSRLVAHFYDGFRHLRKYGTWSWTGMTWDEIWSKYERQVRNEDPAADDDAVRDAVSRRILEKSCCTNQVFDKLAGMTHEDVGARRAQKEETLRAVTVMARRSMHKAKRRFVRPPTLAPGSGSFRGIGSRAARAA